MKYPDQQENDQNDHRTYSDLEFNQTRKKDRESHQIRKILSNRHDDVQDQNNKIKRIVLHVQPGQFTQLNQSSIFNQREIKQNHQRAQSNQIQNDKQTVFIDQPNFMMDQEVNNQYSDGEDYINMRNNQYQNAQNLPNIEFNEILGLRENRDVRKIDPKQARYFVWDPRQDQTRIQDKQQDLVMKRFENHFENIQKQQQIIDQQLIQQFDKSYRLKSLKTLFKANNPNTDLKYMNYIHNAGINISVYKKIKKQGESNAQTQANSYTPFFHELYRGDFNQCDYELQFMYKNTQIGKCVKFHNIKGYNRDNQFMQILQNLLNKKIISLTVRDIIQIKSQKMEFHPIISNISPFSSNLLNRYAEPSYFHQPNNFGEHARQSQIQSNAFSSFTFPLKNAHLFPGLVARQQLFNRAQGIRDQFIQQDTSGIFRNQNQTNNNNLNFNFNFNSNSQNMNNRQQVQKKQPETFQCDVIIDVQLNLFNYYEYVSKQRKTRICNQSYRSYKMSQQNKNKTDNQKYPNRISQSNNLNENKFDSNQVQHSLKDQYNENILLNNKISENISQKDQIEYYQVFPQITKQITSVILMLQKINDLPKKISQYNQKQPNQYDQDELYQNLYPHLSEKNSKKKRKNNTHSNNQSEPITEKNLLQKLFESGKFFSLDSTIVQPSEPSRFFYGHLKDYQKLTLTWMLFRENCQVSYSIERPKQHYDWINLAASSDLYLNKQTHQILNILPFWRKQVKGGLLADEMGLGKTIMSLALIATHLKDKKNSPMQAGTLIIVPLSVLSQWQEAINQYLPDFKLAKISTGAQISKDKIQKADIILTTIGIVRQQRNKQMNKFANARLNQQDNKFYEVTTTFYDFNWFRLILDQADNARNYQSKVALSIKQLQANYIWLLTGTPIHNKIDDLLSYFSILKNQQYFDMIKENMVQSKGLPKSQKSLKLIKYILKDIIVRRKKTTLDENGRQILPLQNFEIKTSYSQLTKKQFQVYIRITIGLIKKIEDYIKKQKQRIALRNLNKKQRLQEIENETNQSKQSVFTKITRLRQFCCHTKLYKSKSKFYHYQDFDRYFKRLVEMRKDRNVSDKRQKRQQTSLNDYRNFFMGDNLLKQQNKIEKRKQKAYNTVIERAKISCEYCQNELSNGILTICFHFYCEDCFKHYWRLNSTKNKSTVKQQNLEKLQQPIQRLQKIGNRKYVQCHNENCREQIGFKQMIDLPRINRFNEPIESIEPNQKMVQALKLIRETNNSEKIVIFTQFLGMIELVMEFLIKNRVTAIFMTGSDTAAQRKTKIQRFSQDQNLKVFVISTKCGYAGLNLQMANHVYFLDPWWNPAIQQQALGRLHRFGQLKKVIAYRFIVKNSIEEVIHFMCQQKKILTDMILDSDDKKKRAQKIQILTNLKWQLKKGIFKFGLQNNLKLFGDGEEGGEQNKRQNRQYSENQMEDQQKRQRHQFGQYPQVKVQSKQPKRNRMPLDYQEDDD